MTVQEILACKIPKGIYSIELRTMQSNLSIYADLENEEDWFMSRMASFEALYKLATHEKNCGL